MFFHNKNNFKSKTDTDYSNEPKIKKMELNRTGLSANQLKWPASALYTLSLFFIMGFLPAGCGTPPEPKQVAGDKYLIVNGDDLCLDAETDQAIITAFNYGILTSTSAFINLPHSVKTLQQIHRENPELPIGLHLNLTFGAPVSSAEMLPNLVNKNGEFYDIGKILRRLSDIPLEEVRKELFAQTELFVSTGVPLDHIDCHHHLAALFTPYFQIVRELALTYDVPVRNPVPVSIYKTISPETKGGGNSASMGKLLLFGITHPFKSIPMMSKVSPEAFMEQERLMYTEGIKSPDWFIDSFYGNATPENFISILQQLPNGVSEIMCHPGMEGEVTVLTHPKVKEAIEIQNLQLISYRYLEEGKWKN
mgnify:CR=1 FL=1